MKISNYMEVSPKLTKSHNGVGKVKDVVLFQDNDFQTNLKFFRYMVLPANTSIGFHKHGDNEEVYIILTGHGVMKVNNEEREVKPGDVIVNEPFDSHSLVNTSNSAMDIFVFEVTK